jgi:hypothetical protein
MAKYLTLMRGNFRKEILSWRPRNCETHQQYKASLYQKLIGVFPLEPIRESAHRRGRADIGFGDDTGIEIANNVDQVGKLRRLRDQMEEYAKTYSHSIVILTGEHDRELVQQIKERASLLDIDVYEK